MKTKSSGSYWLSITAIPHVAILNLTHLRELRLCAASLQPTESLTSNYRSLRARIAFRYYVWCSMGLSLPNSYSEPSLDGLALGAPRIHRDSALLRDIDLLLLGGSVASTTCMGIERSGMLKWRCRFRDLDAGKGGVLAHDRG
jgi:hypothetical protein